MEEMKQEIADLKKEKAALKLKERQAKYQREGITNKKVREGLNAIDAKKRDAREQLNRTAYHGNYGVQNSNKPSIQSVGQSKLQSKRDVTPKKRSKFGGGRSDPAGTAQNNYSNLQGPQGRKFY